MSGTGEWLATCRWFSHLVYHSPRGWILTSKGMAELVGHVPDMWQGVRLEVILFQELEGVLAQELKGDAHVTMEVEPVRH